MKEPSIRTQDSIRIGITLGGWPFPEPDPQYLWDYADRMEKLNLDSIWFSDRIVSPYHTLETVVAMSFIAARTKRLKFGTSVFALPLRNPTVLAKEIATLDYLSGGRVLPAVGLGSEDSREYQACGSFKHQRAQRTDEIVEIMRLLWSRNNVTYQGKYFTLTGISIEPKPIQPGLPPIWFGGRSEAALRRTARLGDGWLVSQAPPEEVKAGIRKIKAMASEFGNPIEDDHYGVLLAFCLADSAQEAESLARPYLLKRRSDIPQAAFSSFGKPEALTDMLDRYIAAGATKFVLRPSCPPAMMASQLEQLGCEIIPRYHQQSDGSHG